MNLKEALDFLKIASDPFNSLTTALDNVHKTARSDDKTPLQNALALEEAKDVFAISNESANVIIFADINDFKNVNEEHGYNAGDTAIQRIGELIQKEFVEGCNAQGFRISGDEFILLFHQDSFESFKLATASFEKCSVSFSEDASDEKTFTVNVSFGIAFNDDVSDFQQLRDQAELACKIAKKLDGRNYIEWTPELERNKLEDIRRNCYNCGIIIRCDVPADKKEAMKIKLCPICGNSLTDE